MTTLATENWTATSSTAWPSQWVAPSSGSSGTASVGNTRGRLLTPAGYAVIRRTLNLASSSATRQTTSTFILSAVTEQYVRLIGRDSGAAGTYPSGYYILVTPATSAWTIRGGFGAGEYGDAANVPVTFVVGNVYGFTILVSEFTVSARLWNITAGQTEGTGSQSTWVETDAAWPTGAPALAQRSGNTTNPYVEFGPVTVTDGASAVTGSVALSGGGTLAAADTPKPTAALGRTGTGTLATSSTPTVVATGARTGSGQLTAAGFPTITAGTSLSTVGALTPRAQRP